jgi:hypothetical protein
VSVSDLLKTDFAKLTLLAVEGRFEGLEYVMMMVFG